MDSNSGAGLVNGSKQSNDSERYSINSDNDSQAKARQTYEQMKEQYRLAEQSVYESSSQRIGLNSEDEPGDGTVDGDEDDDGETGT